MTPEPRTREQPMTLAERLAPHMSGTLIHPGDDQTEPFPVAPLPVFANTATMPKGMVEDIAEQAGLPHPDFALIYCETWLHTLETACEVTLVDNTELADLRAVAANHEHRRNQMIVFHTPCGAHIRAMARGFDTDHAEVPCRLVVHECEGKR